MTKFDMDDFAKMIPYMSDHYLKTLKAFITEVLLDRHAAESRAMDAELKVMRSILNENKDDDNGNKDEK